MIKRYESTTGVIYTFPVVVSNVKHWVETPFQTATTAIQDAIEAHANFTSGKISLGGNYLTNEAARRDDDVVGGGLIELEISVAGEDYVIDDLVTLLPGNGQSGEGGLIKIIDVDEDGGVTGYEIVSKGQGYDYADAVVASAVNVTQGTGLKVNITSVESPVKFNDESPYSHVEFPAATTINDAVKILRAEPYKVHHTKLKTPEMVLAQAIDHSVSFPNWII